jgi:DNA-directed RNA polymerase subunit RPC12/RpoP
MFNLKCPECGYEVNQEQETVAKRALSLHRWVTHRIRSPRAIQEAQRKERKALPQPRELTQVEIEAKIGPIPTQMGSRERENWLKRKARLLHPDRVREQQRRWRTKAKAKAITAAMDPSLTKEDRAVKSNLQQSSWWKVEVPTTGELQPVKLDKCPHCGSEFYIKKGQ